MDQTGFPLDRTKKEHIMIVRRSSVEAIMVRVAVGEFVELLAIGMFLAGVGMMGAALHLA
jgi:hypothetical protein